MEIRDGRRRSVLAAPRLERRLAIGLAALLSTLAASGPAGAQDCALPVVCVDHFGAGAIALETAPAECAEAWTAYRACLRRLTDAAAAPAAGGGPGCDLATAGALWNDVKQSESCAELSAFQEVCPSSPQARIAAARRTTLGCSGAQPGAPRRTASPPEIAPPITETPKIAPPSIAPPSGAAAGAGLQTLRLGVLGGGNASARRDDWACVIDHLRATAGLRSGEIVAPADYFAMRAGLLDGSIDLAWLGASGYAMIEAQRPGAVAPALLDVRDGETGYYSVMIARSGAGVDSLADLKGRRLALPDPNSTSGYLIPRIELARRGVDLESGAFFGDVRFVGGHEPAIMAVLSDEADAAVTWSSGVGDRARGYSSGALRKMVDKGFLDMDRIVEIWRSDLIPYGPVVLRTDLPTAARRSVTEALKAMPRTDPACLERAFPGVSGFAPVSRDAYASLIEARRLKR